MYRRGKTSTICVYNVVAIAEIDSFLGWFIIEASASKPGWLGENEAPQHVS